MILRASQDASALFIQSVYFSPFGDAVLAVVHWKFEENLLAQDENKPLTYEIMA